VVTVRAWKWLEFQSAGLTFLLAFAFFGFCFFAAWVGARPAHLIGQRQPFLQLGMCTAVLMVSSPSFGDRV